MNENKIIQELYNVGLGLLLIIIVSTICILCKISDISKIKSNPLLKTEYEVELVNQTHIKVYNGKEVKTIHRDSLLNYFDNDNM